MGFIFWMSTGTFSSENTRSLFETGLRLLVPGISSDEVDLVHTISRKAAHVFEYFILGLLLFRAFKGASAASWNWRWPLLTVTIVLFWAASDEFHQSLVSTRTASVVDAGIDTAGGVLSQIATAVRYRYQRK
jgi:VanZ family protein